MSQEYYLTYRTRKKQKKQAQKVWDWLVSLGEFFVELGRCLISLGWTIYRVGEWLLSLLGVSDWREDYR
jgi:hypothetical protein